jgi:4'-phosphopantetheinyl transferase
VPTDLEQYSITKHWQLETGIHIFLLEVEINLDRVNIEIIPEEQKIDIAKYHQTFEQNKRLLARSFLFEYCQKHYHLKHFAFVYNEYQQPRFDHSQIKFSLSYSGKFVLIGISEHTEIGVDIEQKDSELEYTEIAQLVMHTNELKFFQTLSNQDQLNYFYTLWSGKESLIKAWGKGLYYPVTEINLMTNDSQVFSNESRNYQCTPLEGIDQHALAVSYEK